MACRMRACITVAGVIGAFSVFCPIPGFAGTLVYGPERFERGVGSPSPAIRAFSVEDVSGAFWLQITNGSAGRRLIESAVVVLNGRLVVSPDEFRGLVLGFSRNISLEVNNILQVEVRGVPGTFLTVEIRKADGAETLFNRDHDFWGAREQGFVGLWWEPQSGVAEYVVFRGPSIAGPWQELFRRPGHRPNAIDASPEAQIHDVCYRVEGRNAKGKEVRSYDSLCFLARADEGLGMTGRSALVAAVSVPRVAASNAQPFNSMCLSDSEFQASNAMSQAEIQAFLASRNSFLRTEIVDVDGVVINPSQLIFDAAQRSGVSAQAILTTLEKEQRAVRSSARLKDSALRLIMGFDPRHVFVPPSSKSIREQIMDAAAQWRRDLNRLGATPPQPTAGGWQVGVSSSSVDGVLVTPARRVVAVLFSYTPEVGEGWGGGIGVGGNFLYCQLWQVFGFLRNQVLIYFGNGGMGPSDEAGASTDYFQLQSLYEQMGFVVSYTDAFPGSLGSLKAVILVAPGKDDDTGAHFFTAGQVGDLARLVIAGGRLIALGDHSGAFGINTMNDLLLRLGIGIRQRADRATPNGDLCPPLTDITSDQITAGIAWLGGLDPSASSSLLVGGTALSLVRVQTGFTCGVPGSTVLAVDQTPGAPPRPGGDVVVSGDLNVLDDLFGFGDPRGDGNSGNVKLAENLVSF